MKPVWTFLVRPARLSGPPADLPGVLGAFEPLLSTCSSGPHVYGLPGGLGGRPSWGLPGPVWGCPAGGLRGALNPP